MEQNLTWLLVGQEAGGIEKGTGREVGMVERANQYG